MQHGPHGVAALGGGVGAEELGPGFFEDHGPDLTGDTGGGVEGTVGPTFPHLHRNVIIHSDVHGLALHVELDRIRTRLVNLLRHEEVFNSARPAIKRDHRRDHVAVADAALLHGRDNGLLLGSEQYCVDTIDFGQSFPRHFVAHSYVVGIGRISVDEAVALVVGREVNIGPLVGRYAQLDAKLCCLAPVGSVDILELCGFDLGGRLDLDGGRYPDEAECAECSEVHLCLLSVLLIINFDSKGA